MKPKNPNEAERSRLQLFQARLDWELNPDHPLFCPDIRNENGRSDGVRLSR